MTDEVICSCVSCLGFSAGIIFWKWVSDIIFGNRS